MNPTLQSIPENLSPEHDALWAGLRDRRLDGVEFNLRRNHEAGGVDFFCAEANLAVEISEDIPAIQVSTEVRATPEGRRSPFVLHLPASVIRQNIGRAMAVILGRIRSSRLACAGA